MSTRMVAFSVLLVLNSLHMVLLAANSVHILRNSQNVFRFIAVKDKKFWRFWIRVASDRDPSGRQGIVHRFPASRRGPRRSRPHELYTYSTCSTFLQCTIYMPTTLQSSQIPLLSTVEAETSPIHLYYSSTVLFLYSSLLTLSTAPHLDAFHRRWSQDCNSQNHTMKEHTRNTLCAKLCQCIPEPILSYHTYQPLHNYPLEFECVHHIMFLPQMITPVQPIY